MPLVGYETFSDLSRTRTESHCSKRDLNKIKASARKRGLRGERAKNYVGAVQGVIARATKGK